MRIFAAGLMIATLFAGVVGCKKSDGSASTTAPAPAQTPDAQIRTAIEAHLAHNTNLNLKAFDTEVKQVTIDGDHAQAQVDFHLKGGPAVMQLSYKLEQREGSWAVIDSDPVGSNFSHPPLDQSQAPPAGAPMGGSHSLDDTLKSFKSGAGGSPRALPPGHPPISGSSSQLTQQ